MLCAGPQFWPQPTGVIKISNTAVAVHEDLFSLQILSFPSTAVREHLEKAFKLFRTNVQMVKNNSRVFQRQHAVIIRVAINENGSTDPRMQLDTDESYQLSLNKKNNFVNVNISSNSFCGSRHALETLLQMVWVDPYTKGLFILEEAFVDDAPRFKYRGLMLDTTQTYFPIKHILRTIDGMAASKLNTFHWRTMNSQRFSLQLTNMPRLDLYGIYDQMYTTEDVRAVASYARIRGIRVLIDFDLLIYVENAWLWEKQSSVMDLIPSIESKATKTCERIDFNEPHILNIILEIYKEIIELTGVDDIYYLGGGEVHRNCWLQKFNTTWSKITLNIFRKIESDYNKLPNMIILWSDLFDSTILNFKAYYDKIILQTRNPIWPPNYFSGSCVIISNLETWDLNSGYGTWYEESSTRYNTWQKVYEYRPWARKAVSCVEGGEVTVWTSILDADGLDVRIWPRAAAFAERVWSDRPESVTHSVQTRLNLQRRRLMNRDIKSAPLWSTWCTCNTIYC